jgi:hypothetical protein
LTRAVVAKAGRDDRQSGGVWRVHAVFDLPTERFSTFELTDEREGERFDRAAVAPGEIRIGDRAYLQPDRMGAVLAAGADIVVRAKWNGARWLDSYGGKIDLMKLLKKARKDCLDRPIWIGRPSGAPLALRLVAIRKPPEATEKARTRLRVKAREKRHVLQDGTLVAAGWVIHAIFVKRKRGDYFPRCCRIPGQGCRRPVSPALADRMPPA